MSADIIKATIEQTGFHGIIHVPISGCNWRAWNESIVAVDMDDDAVRAMFRAASCPSSDRNIPYHARCVCGGGYTAMPLDRDTYGLPYTWLTDADCPDLLRDLAKKMNDDLLELCAEEDESKC